MRCLIISLFFPWCLINNYRKNLITSTFCLLNARLQNHYTDIEEVFVKQILLLLLAVNSDGIKRKKRRVNHSQKVVMWVSQKQRAKSNFQVNLTTWPSEPRAKAQDLYVIYWYIAAMEIFSILLRNSLNTPVYLEFWMVQKSLSTPPVFSVEKHSQFKTKESKNCFFFSPSPSFLLFTPSVYYQCYVLIGWATTRLYMLCYYFRL